MSHNGNNTTRSRYEVAGGCFGYRRHGIVRPARSSFIPGQPPGNFARKEAVRRLGDAGIRRAKFAKLAGPLH